MEETQMERIAREVARQMDSLERRVEVQLLEGVNELMASAQVLLGQVVEIRKRRAAQEAARDG